MLGKSTKSVPHLYFFILKQVTYATKEKTAFSYTVLVKPRPKRSVCDKDQILAVLTTNGPFSRDNDTYVRNVRAKVKQ